MAKQVVIQNPIINSPFAEPQRHFRFDEEGITNQIVAGRRPSSYFVPIAQPKKKGKGKDKQQIDFHLARVILERFFRDENDNDNVWLFPDLLRIAREWREQCLHLKDNTFLQLLILIEHRSDATVRIYKAIVAASEGEKRLLPIPKRYDTIGSTQWVRFDTVRPTYKTDPQKCHVSHVVADTNSWEQKMAQTLEGMPEVIRYVKNHNLGFTIPYTINGQQKRYFPNFIVHIDDGNGIDDPLQLIVEVSGDRDKKKEAKTRTAQICGFQPSITQASGDAGNRSMGRHRTDLGKDWSIRRCHRVTQI